MLARLFSLLRPAVPATAALFLGMSVVPSTSAQTLNPPSETTRPYREGPSQGGEPSTTSSSTVAERMRPGYFAVVCPAGCYGGGFHWFGCRAYAGPGYYGFFRRYWAYGTYGPNYNLYTTGLPYGIPSFTQYQAIPRGHKFFKHRDGSCLAGGPGPGALPDGVGGPGVSPVSGPGGTNPPTLPAKDRATPPTEKASPPTDNTAHLQLLVPENAEVVVDGAKTAATGTVREFVSPSLPPGKRMIYTVVVRYVGADGKPIEESHEVRVRAHDRLRIDCTQPPGGAEQAAIAGRKP
jgi:uncharacterized protein (TIGR03000 family)